MKKARQVYFFTLLICSFFTLPLTTSAVRTNFTNIKTWTSDATWIYSTTTPFVGNETSVTISGGPNWLPANYNVIGTAVNFTTPDGSSTMLRLNATPASSTPAIGGLGFTDRLSGAATKRIIFDGNSLTAGANASNNHTYPLQTIYSLNDANYTLTNFGVGGQTTVQMSSDAVSQIDTQYNSTSTNTLVAWEITNDLYFGAASTTAYTNFVAYAQARKTAGWKVIILSVLPRSDTSTPVSFEASRQSINSRLRSDFAVPTSNPRIFAPSQGTSYADLLVDVAANSNIGDAGDELNTVYYATDKVHMTDAGYSVVAGDTAAGYWMLYSSSTVSTIAASSISTSTAMLNALIGSIGGSNSSQSGFAYGTSSTLDTVIATTSLGVQTGAVSFAQTVTDLNPSTTYYFRAYATNVVGTSTGSILSFSTPDLPVISVEPLVAPAPYFTPGSSSGPESIPLSLRTPETPAAPATLAVSTTFSSSLSTGMSSPDVKNLQKYLNSKSFTVSKSGAGSPGKETLYFGPATKAALIRFQKANNIYPSIGFLGPLTRAFIANMK